MKLNRRKKAIDNATLFLNKFSKPTLWEPERPDVTVKEIMDFRHDAITSKLGVAYHDVPSLWH